MLIAKGYCPNFYIRDEFRETINEIFLWCIDRPNKLDINKGLWLCGNNGTGKTTLLYIIREFCRQIGKKCLDGDDNIPYSFRINNASMVAGEFNKHGYSGIEQYVSLSRQAFDELGSEPQLTSYFGTPMNVMQYVLQRRYDRRFEFITHVTTNLRIDEIAQIYGDRIYDRCKEMFNFIFIEGASFRGANVNRL